MDAGGAVALVVRRGGGVGGVGRGDPSVKGGKSHGSKGRGSSMQVNHACAAPTPHPPTVRPQADNGNHLIRRIVIFPPTRSPPPASASGSPSASALAHPAPLQPFWSTSAPRPAAVLRAPSSCVFTIALCQSRSGSQHLSLTPSATGTSLERLLHRPSPASAHWHKLEHRCPPPSPPRALAPGPARPAPLGLPSHCCSLPRRVRARVPRAGPASPCSPCRPQTRCPPLPCACGSAAALPLPARQLCLRPQSWPAQRRCQSSRLLLALQRPLPPLRSSWL